MKTSLSTLIQNIYRHVVEQNIKPFRAVAWGSSWLIVSPHFTQVDKKKKEKKDKERENEKEKNALTKDKVQKKRQTTSPTTTIQRSRPETRWSPLIFYSFIYIVSLVHVGERRWEKQTQGVHVSFIHGAG